METFHGYIATITDALLVIEACRLGYVKRVQRRLSDEEKAMYIKSGAIFVWDETESGIKRWTDGKGWSPSRIYGSFLVYREIEKGNRSERGDTPSLSSSTSRDDLSVVSQSDTLIKEDGLVKRALSVCTKNGRKQHLISYYSKKDIEQGLLRTPTEIPSLAKIRIDAGLYPDFIAETETGIFSPLTKSTLTSSTSSLNSNASTKSNSMRPRAEGAYHGRLDKPAYNTSLHRHNSITLTDNRATSRPTQETPSNDANRWNYRKDSAQPHMYRSVTSHLPLTSHSSHGYGTLQNRPLLDRPMYEESQDVDMMDVKVRPGHRPSTSHDLDSPKAIYDFTQLTKAEKESHKPLHILSPMSGSTPPTSSVFNAPLDLSKALPTPTPSSTSHTPKSAMFQEITHSQGDAHAQPVVRPSSAYKMENIINSKSVKPSSHESWQDHSTTSYPSSISTISETEEYDMRLRSLRDSTSSQRSSKHSSPYSYNPYPADSRRGSKTEHFEVRRRISTLSPLVMPPGTISRKHSTQSQQSTLSRRPTLETPLSPVGHTTGPSAYDQIVMQNLSLEKNR